ncbi:MAG: thermostable hemolysin [Gammaproteobacteria bacterium]|nr:thermostable hemolysin [Gammaproteobacteria bacterium]
MQSGFYNEVVRRLAKYKRHESLSDYVNNKSLDLCVKVIEGKANSREGLEYYLKEKYHQRFSAKIKWFMPKLVALCLSGGEVLAVVGVQSAETVPLCLEKYLAEPVDVLINSQGCANSSVSRKRIVEVGNFASSHSSSNPLLLYCLTAYLYGSGYEWMVFTVLPSFKKMILRMGLDICHLGVAEKECLESDEKLMWGSYYEKVPEVCAGSLVQAYKEISPFLSEDNSLACKLWQEAYELGRSSVKGKDFKWGVNG